MPPPLPAPSTPTPSPPAIPVPSTPTPSPPATPAPRTPLPPSPAAPPVAPGGPLASPTPQPPPAPAAPAAGVDPLGEQQPLPVMDPSPPLRPPRHPTAAVRPIRGRPHAVRAPPSVATRTLSACASAHTRPPMCPHAPPGVRGRPSTYCRPSAALQRYVRPRLRRHVRPRLRRLRRLPRPRRPRPRKCLRSCPSGAPSSVGRPTAMAAHTPSAAGTSPFAPGASPGVAALQPSLAPCKDHRGVRP